MHQRLERRRWVSEVRRICERLGTYSFLDVRREILNADGKKRKDGTRRDVGCYTPTDKQLSALLRCAEWSERVQPGGGHAGAVYRFSPKYQEQGEEER